MEREGKASTGYILELVTGVGNWDSPTSSTDYASECTTQGMGKGRHLALIHWLQSSIGQELPYRYELPCASKLHIGGSVTEAQSPSSGIRKTVGQNAPVSRVAHNVCGERELEEDTGHR